MANAKLLDIAGSMYVPYVMLANSNGGAIVTPSAGTLTSVASTTSDSTILAANALRGGAIIYNESTSILYLLLASGVSSTTAYSMQVPANGNFTISPGDYTGIIKGNWASANGFARVTEFA